jgi:hypothetical protein
VKRLTKAQRRKAEFEEELYATLREYQERQKEPAAYKSGVTAGHLDIELTRVFDRVRAAFEKHSAPAARASTP